MASRRAPSKTRRRPTAVAAKAQVRSSKRVATERQPVRKQAPANRGRLALVHEISVYQDELLLQNDALLNARRDLEESRERFVELYDFAPVAYLTLDVQGVIRLGNLTATAMLGRSRHSLEGTPFLVFVARRHRPIFVDFLRRCRVSSGAAVAAEFTTLTGDGERDVQVLCRPHIRNQSSSPEFFMSLVDITRERTLERDRGERAREYAALATRLIAVQDDERQRIARNLHDDIGQQVTALRLKIDEAGLASTDALRLKAIARLQELVETLDQRLHFVAAELRPATLDLGIATALEQFVNEWSSNFGISVQFHSGDADHFGLTPEAETHVYRIAQEALNNISKHAGARHVAVLLEHREDGFVLVIEDDGRGFDVAAIRSEGAGLGLINMRERAQLLGGTLEIETDPGKGTSIFLRVPHTDRLRSYQSPA